MCIRFSNHKHCTQNLNVTRLGTEFKKIEGGKQKMEI